GHAIETFEHYDISHGEAVAIGMLVEAYLALQRGYIEESFIVHLEHLLRAYGLVLKTKAFQDLTHFKSLLLLDKKTIQAQARFVLLKQIGHVYHEGDIYSFAMTPEILLKGLQWAAARFGSATC
ncbi:MAG TPA: hypothetical protein VHD33_04365, partial [Legionellaceae bacterium]|nr:hypothetical protein [Legionellaceae bacterium]